MRAVINILSVVEKRSGEREEDADRKKERPDEERRSFSLNLSLSLLLLFPLLRILYLGSLSIALLLAGFLRHRRR